MESRGVSLDPKIVSILPRLRLLFFQWEVAVAPSDPEFLAWVDTRLAVVMARIPDNEAIAALPAVKATREAYRACGKDPARYRPSAEALLRRVVSGKGLYSINQVVDLLNLISVETGYSIGGWDASAIQGGMSLGIGQAGEPYEAIGRGELNIEGLPVMRDELGAFGTPTSDSLRTMVRPETKDFLFCLYDFGGGPLEEAIQKTQELYSSLGIGRLKGSWIFQPS